MILERHPQVPPGRPPHTFDYQVDGDVLAITHRTYRRGDPDPNTGEQPVAIEAETVDTFDFTGTPDGQLDIASIETDLPIQPILAASRTDGQLTVTVIDWGDSDG